MGHFISLFCRVWEYKVSCYLKLFPVVQRAVAEFSAPWRNRAVKKQPVTLPDLSKVHLRIATFY